MLGEKAWCVLGVPVHSNGVQWFFAGHLCSAKVGDVELGLMDAS